jgi:hypothetical protein
MAQDEEFASAAKRAGRRLEAGPVAVAARYDRRGKRVVVRLKSGLDIGFAPGETQGLETAKPEQLDEIEISPSGLGLHFPKLDVDVYLPALLDGVMGSAAWMAARLGARGGKARTPAKRTAARANGRLGGRPRKSRVS